MQAPERNIWHQHFIPSLIAGLVIGSIVYLYDTTVANVLFFASVGATAVILSNSTSHHLVKLRTALIAYGLLMVVAPLVKFVSQELLVHEALTIGALVFGLSLSMFWLHAFHPPAISAAIAFIFFEGSWSDLVALFVLVIATFVGVRFLMYVYYEHFSPREFWHEFRLTTGRYK